MENVSLLCQYKHLLQKATIREVQVKLCFAALCSSHHGIKAEPLFSSYTSRSAQNTPPSVAPAVESRTTLLWNQFTSDLTYQINTSANPGDLPLTGKVPTENVWRAWWPRNKPPVRLPHFRMLFHRWCKKSRCPTPTPLKKTPHGWDRKGKWHVEQQHTKQI